MSIGRHERPNKGATDVWLTPKWIVNGFGIKFDLDPCAELGHEHAIKNYYTNGLSRPWTGAVWLNPPYSEVGAWLDKLAIHGKGVALVFARTDTKWAQKHLHLATSVFFPAGRIHFERPCGTKAGNAGAPSMFLGYGHTPLINRVAPMEGWFAK